MSSATSTEPAADISGWVSAEEMQLDDNQEDSDYDNNIGKAASDEEDSDASDVEEVDSELDDAIAEITRHRPTVKIPAAKFDIPFEVPFKNGMRDLKGITSTTTFDEFLAAAAAKMGTRITHMDNILDDDDAWETLVADVRQPIKASQAANRGKGQLKPFSIQVVDLSKLEDDVKAGKKASGTGHTA
ncbi:hypothetical protein B0H13DRAFT_2358220 [Mycena leptocephala]|nr:hypothetical protein B0H13DRAFT_2358220 [Mycena leptocephala]